jgi:hypothetical protein
MIFHGCIVRVDLIILMVGLFFWFATVVACVVVGAVKVLLSFKVGLVKANIIATMQTMPVSQFSVIFKELILPMPIALGNHVVQMLVIRSLMFAVLLGSIWRKYYPV